MVAMVQPLVPVVLVALLQLVTSLSLFDAKQDLHVVPERNRKVWRRSLLFSNPDNWEGGALPCPGDKLVFPRDLRDSAAYLAAGERVTPPLEVREVELPWHGVVVLGHPGQGDRGRTGDSGQLRSSSGLVIGGEDSRSRSCPGR
ncbi:Protein amnionless, partial [Frankliniella occidentalis]